MSIRADAHALRAIDHGRQGAVEEWVAHPGRGPDNTPPSKEKLSVRGSTYAPSCETATSPPLSNHLSSIQNKKNARAIRLSLRPLSWFVRQGTRNEGAGERGCRTSVTGMGYIAFEKGTARRRNLDSDDCQLLQREAFDRGLPAVAYMKASPTRWSTAQVARNRVVRDERYDEGIGRDCEGVDGTARVAIGQAGMRNGRTSPLEDGVLPPAAKPVATTQRGTAQWLIDVPVYAPVLPRSSSARGKNAPVPCGSRVNDSGAQDGRRPSPLLGERPPSEQGVAVLVLVTPCKSLCFSPSSPAPTSETKRRDTQAAPTPPRRCALDRDRHDFWGRRGSCCRSGLQLTVEPAEEDKGGGEGEEGSCEDSGSTRRGVRGAARAEYVAAKSTSVLGRPEAAYRRRRSREPSFTSLRDDGRGTTSRPVLPEASALAKKSLADERGFLLPLRDKEGGGLAPQAITRTFIVGADRTTAQARSAGNNAQTLRLTAAPGARCERRRGSAWSAGKYADHCQPSLRAGSDRVREGKHDASDRRQRGMEYDGEQRNKARKNGSADEAEVVGAELPGQADGGRSAVARSQEKRTRKIKRQAWKEWKYGHTSRRLRTSLRSSKLLQTDGFGSIPARATVAANSASAHKTAFYLALLVVRRAIFGPSAGPETCFSFVGLNFSENTTAQQLLRAFESITASPLVASSP
ncbi:hypothetical protein C8R47DRAFT_1082274 [Mycena vitilis]|nr:hypothetical protein C8R47DRAFT_1082274 [Mycena vitilis]